MQHSPHDRWGLGRTYLLSDSWPFWTISILGAIHNYQIRAVTDSNYWLSVGASIDSYSVCPDYCVDYYLGPGSCYGSSYSNYLGANFDCFDFGYSLFKSVNVTLPHSLICPPLYPTGSLDMIPNQWSSREWFSQNYTIIWGVNQNWCCMH